MIEWTAFSPKALDFIQHSTAKLCILDGSVRSGKTVNCTVRWLTYLATGPKGDLVMLGKTRDTLQRNVLNDIHDIVGEKNFKWVNKQGGELMLCGRRVYCVGANNEDSESKIRGATFAGALCDEVSLYPRSVFNQLMARLSIKGAQCFCNTNPDSPYHWFYTDYVANKQITNKQCWHFRMEDNLSLDPAYMEQLKSIYRAQGVWYDRMILGKWAVAEGRIYDMFDRSRHMVDTSKLYNPKQVTWLVGCDYATSSVMSWGLYAKTFDGKYLKVKEFYYDARIEHKQRSDAEFGMMFQVWLGKVHPWFVYCDPSAVSWIEELRGRGYRVTAANNDVIDGIRYVASLLTTNRYVVDKSCKNTEDEYGTYVWDEKAQLQGNDKPVKQHDHAVDTDRYVLYSDKGSILAGVYK